MEITLIVPSIPNDVQKLMSNIDTYFRYLPIGEICLIGPEEVRGKIPENDARLSFIPETEIVDFGKIKDLIGQVAGEDAAKRTGWYVQQFIKMGYARRTEDEYYLLWDSDTVPVKQVELFDQDGVPFLDCKTEYHEAYFRTIQALLPEVGKEIKESFIAEHMLINTKIMRELLCRIEENEKLEGTGFDEKIIHAIAMSDIAGSGFSEFETYGSFTYKHHGGAYKIRHWNSMRNGGFFFDGTVPLPEKSRNWLAKSYDAVTFEKGDSLSFLSKLVQSDLYVRILGARTLEGLAVMIKAVRKISGKR